MSPSFEGRAIEGQSSPLPMDEISKLRFNLAALEVENNKLGELLATADRLHATDTESLADLRTSEAALASARAETKEGQSGLVTSALALAAARAETKAGLTQLLASALALASSQAETKEGQADLRASEVALTAARAATREGLTELLESALALASSQAETKERQTDLQASEVALATARAETIDGQTDLRASEVALTAARAETKAGLTQLLASALALASSQAEAKEGQTVLRASEVALASARAENIEGQTDLRVSEAALASARAENKEGQTDLQASVRALASSRVRTQEGLAYLLASDVALALWKAKTREGQTDLLASALALASARAENKEGQTHLLASALALATAQAETKEGKTDLLASEVALALARAEGKEGETNLRASEAALVWSQAKTREGESDLLASALALAASLRKGEERFRRLIEAAPSALVMINQAGQIEMVNVQTERLFGYTRSELLGAPAKMLLPATLPPVAYVEGLSTDFAGPSSRPMAEEDAVYGVKKNGSQIAVEVGLSPIETDEGMMVLAAIVDISRRVRLEGEIRQTLKMHAIGRVTAGVAHDFNNLLQALVGSLEVLLEIVADQPDAVEWGEMALQATTRGRELTDRLLSFSRKQVLTASAISIDALFCGLKQLINHLFETNTKARTELVMVRCASDMAVLADHAQLETALINLAVNARDAIALGGCLRISAFEADADPDILPPGRYTVISVVDTGTGMDADTLAQAFDPFFTTKGHNGTGLGLSMVQGFARQSGGDVYITSVMGEGTTIELWLPSASAPSEVKNLVAAPLPMVGRILVVDDSPDVLRLVSTFLRRSGLDVTSKANGDLALAELAAGNRFDVIVTDFAMPGMNGLELLTRACAIDQSVRGMIITGFSDPELLSELNHFVVLRKPFNRAELIETVMRLIGAKRDDHCEERDPRYALPAADS